MALNIPTTAEVTANIVAQIEASISQAVPLLPRAFIRVLAKAMAGVFILLYKFGGFIFLQMFVSTATFGDVKVGTRVINPLIEWGRLIGVGDPTAAIQAEITATVTVLNQVGSLPANSQLIGGLNQVTYISTAAVLLNAATVSVPCRAVEDPGGNNGTGVVGNLDPGDALQFANPLADVARDAVVLTLDTTGADGETETDYRQRVVDRFQAQPQGGAYADYRLWGSEVAGVRRIYPYTGDPGEVDVFVEADTSIDPDGIPPGSMLTDVFDAIEKDEAGIATRRNANAFVNSLAITRTGFDVTVTGLTAPTGLAAIQAEITAAIELYFRNREPFVDGLTLPPRLDRIKKTDLIAIVGEIVNLNNAEFTDVSFEPVALPGFPQTLFSLGEGETAKASSVTYV